MDAETLTDYFKTSMAEAESYISTSNNSQSVIAQQCSLQIVTQIALVVGKVAHAQHCLEFRK